MAAIGHDAYWHKSTFPKLARGRIGDRLCGNAEMLVKVLVGRAGAETGHTHKGAVGTDDGVPALAHSGFHADFDLGVADDGAALAVLRLQQQFEADRKSVV